MTAQTPEKLTKRLRREASIPPQRDIVRDVITQLELEAVLLLEQCQNANFSGLVKRYFAGASVEPGKIVFRPGNAEDIGDYAGPCNGSNCLSAHVDRRREPAAEEPVPDAPAVEPEKETEAVRIKLDAFIEKHGDAAVLGAMSLYEKIAALDLDARYSALAHLESCTLGYPVDRECACQNLGTELVEETYGCLMASGGQADG